MRKGRLALIAAIAVAAAYPVAALQTPPGFYEGFCPPVDYHFLSPPPQQGANKSPAAGHAEIKIVKNSAGASIVSAGSVFTADDNPQASLSFVPNAFQLPSDLQPEVIDIKPVKDYPPAPGLAIVTNVYLITSTTPMTQSSNLRLLYSTVLPAPSTIYQAQPGGTWQALNSSTSSTTGCSDVVAQVSSTGYFMAGYPSSSTKPGSNRVGGGQLLPIVVALAILIVVLAGVPLAVLRRRQGGSAEAAPGTEDDPPPPRT